MGFFYIWTAGFPGSIESPRKQYDLIAFGITTWVMTEFV